METSGNGEYRQDGGDSYYDKDQEGQDINMISFEEKLRYEIGYFIGSVDIHDRVDRGHQFEDMISSCTWKGLDCKTGYGLICVKLIRLL